MDLKVLQIKVYKQERKVVVKLEKNQTVTFRPFGLDFMSEVTEFLNKEAVRHIGEKVNKLDYFRRHKERIDPNLSEQKGAEMELSQFVGKTIKTIY